MLRGETELAGDLLQVRGDRRQPSGIITGTCPDHTRPLALGKASQAAHMKVEGLPGPGALVGRLPDAIQGGRGGFPQKAQCEVQDFDANPADRLVGQSRLGRCHRLCQPGAHSFRQVDREEGPDLAQWVAPPARKDSISG